MSLSPKHTHRRIRSLDQLGKNGRSVFFGLLLMGVAVGAGVTVDRFALLHVPSAVLAPSSADADRVSFFALGDIGKGEVAQRRVAAAMETIAATDGNISFTVLLGDVFYSNGITSVDDPLWQRYFESVYDTPYLSGMPFYAALGNHDYRGNVDAHMDYARQRLGSGRYRIPSRYYVQDFGRGENGPLVRIFFADTNARGSAAAQQANAIREVFSEKYNKPEWRIVVGHHPVRNFGYHGETPWLLDWLLPVMKEVGVHAYVSGHDHDQQAIATDGEPLYIISGGGGKSLHEIARSGEALKFGAAQYGFVKITVDTDALAVEFFDDSAQLSYQLGLARPCKIDERPCLVEPASRPHASLRR